MTWCVTALALLCNAGVMSFRAPPYPNHSWSCGICDAGLLGFIPFHHGFQEGRAGKGFPAVTRTCTEGVVRQQPAAAHQASSTWYSSTTSLHDCWSVGQPAWHIHIVADVHACGNWHCKAIAEPRAGSCCGNCSMAAAWPWHPPCARRPYVERCSAL